MAKSALIAFGNEESYGLSFVGGELKEHGQDIRFFDGEGASVVDEVVKWKPDFLMYSPMTTFFPIAHSVNQQIRNQLDAVSIFGGHHAFSQPGLILCDDIDTIVVGPVRGSIPEILNGRRGLIRTIPTNPADMPKPARYEYYRDVPRMGKRYRKFVLSMLGCPWSCSYCSSSSKHIREVFGKIDYYRNHRPVSDVISELKEIMQYETYEIDWVDDDFFAGNEEWLLEFARRFDFDIPMYVSTTSVSVLNVSDRALRAFQRIVNVVGMGIQAIRPKSLKLFNRSWDNEEKMKAAYDRLTSFGYKVNLQAIIGLPVVDPVEDALDTIKGLQRIGPGSVCSVYPLMIYPGTAIKEYCKEKGFLLNEDCNGDTNSGICGIRFTPKILKQIRNLCKLATFIVKYNLDEKLVRALMNIDFDEKTSKELSMLRYRECVIDRLGDKGERIFNDILSSMKLKF